MQYRGHTDLSVGRASRRSFSLESLEVRTLLAASPVISEFVAKNTQSFDDGNGKSSDWVELYNAGDEAVNLSGWYLSDNADDLNRWQFPSVDLPPDGYLVVIASGNGSPNYVDQDGNQHTNFKLAATGESLILSDPDLKVVDRIDFSQQYEDISFGLDSENRATTGFLSPATPGGPNGVVRNGVSTVDVEMNRESGVFSNSISVEITATPDTTIVFTLDGSLPTETSTVYANPIEINASTQVRARVFEEGKVLGPVTTETYIKVDAEVSQFSSQIPIMVIDNLGAGDIPNTGWNQTNAGIRQLPRQAANLMLFSSEAAPSQLTPAANLSSRIGLRVRGAFSSTFPEPGLSVESWSDGADIDEDISPLGIAADSDWVLYAPNPAHDQTLIDNSFLFEMSNQMGHWAPEVRYVEAFVNDDGGEITMEDHVGIYVITEKVKRTPDRIDMEEMSIDGSSGGWILDVNRMDSIALDGTSPRNFHTAGPNGRLQTDFDLSDSSSRGDDIPRQHNAYINYDDPNGFSINPEQRSAISEWFQKMEDVLYGRVEGVTWNDPVNGYPKYIDVDNFIDYFILNDISHNGDGLLISLWLYNSDPSGDGKLRIGPIWDADLGSYTGLPSFELMRRTDRLWYGQMFKDPNFVLRYTERWQELRRTVFTDDNMANTIDRFFNDIGDEVAVRDDVRNWRTRLDRMQTWLSDRATAIDALFVPAPEFNRESGAVPAGTELKIVSDQGDIFYTLDGSDPRAADGTVSPQAIPIETVSNSVVPLIADASYLIPDASINEQLGATWIEADFVEGASGEEWTSGMTSIGYDNGTAYDDVIQTDVVDVDHTINIRIPFDLNESQLDEIDNLFLRMQFDDGFIAFLNGTEIARRNASGNIGELAPFDSRATAAHRARLDRHDDFSFDHESLLRVGKNVLAIQGINRSVNDRDMLIRPELIGLTVVSPPITIEGPTNVFARTKIDEDWSGPAIGTFTVSTVGLPGDLNDDGRLSEEDINRLCQAIHDGDEQFDLSDNGLVDTGDLFVLIRDLFGTSFGDANLDGLFDSSDLVEIFRQGEYEDGIAGNSTWSSGDWNCDGEFDTRDLVVAFKFGSRTL